MTNPLFLLIHGTWAPKSKWSYPTSSLGQALAAQFEGCTIDRVQWSGSNTFAARLDAAEEIKRKTENHDGPVFLIGHSHGGSAAMYALRDSQSLRDKVKGAVFMSTPFMAFALRPGYRSLYVGLVAALFLLVMLPVMFFIGFFGLRGSFSEGAHSIAVVIVGGLAFSLAAAVAYGLYISRDRVVAMIAGLIARAKSYETVHASNTPILLLRSTGDEVALALGTLQLLATISGKLSAWLAATVSGIVEMLDRATRNPLGKATTMFIAIGLVFVCVVAGGFAAAFGLNFKYWIDSVAPLATSWSLDDPVFNWAYRLLLVVVDGLVVLLGTTSLLFVVFTIIAWSISVLALWVFGELSPVRAFWFEYAAEPLPFGEHTFIHIAWNDNPKERVTERFSLHHSEPYADANAIKQLIIWMEKVCG